MNPRNIDGQRDPLVVVIISGVPLGGGGRYALAARVTTLASDFEGRGFAVRLAAPDGFWNSVDEVYGARETVSRPSRAWGNSVGFSSVGPIDAVRVFLRASRGLRRRSKRSSIVILSTGVWMPIAARALSALIERTHLHLDVPGIPHNEVILGRPRFWRAKTWLYRGIFSRALRHSDIVTTINSAHRTYLRDNFGVSPLIVPDLLKPEWLDKLLAIPELASREHPNILYVGALVGSRLDLFLKVLAKVGNKRAIKALVVGDGPDRPVYEEKFAGTAVRFAGFEPTENLLEHISKADICYSDVWHEIGTPYKILEYMAAGRAVLSHDTDSLRETITDNVDGLLCKTDPASLEAALAKLIEDPNLRIRIGKAARQRMLTIHAGDRLRGLEAQYRMLGGVGSQDSNDVVKT
jgi:glycosyltransferase involved in cell wall biosynthesis